ncbi:MAG: hypothetical protein ACYC6G_16050 [Desulfobaccales bacterium]
MKIIGSALVLTVMLVISVTASYAQEQSPNKATQDSRAEEKKDSPAMLGGITDVIKAQKEKYQKDIQDQIQNKVKSIEDKFNAVKSLAGKTEPEKATKQETTSTPTEAGKEGAGKKPLQAAGQTANSGSDFWGKLNALYEATMAFLRQLMAILFQ